MYVPYIPSYGMYLIGEKIKEIMGMKHQKYILINVNGTWSGDIGNPNSGWWGGKFLRAID